MVQPWAGKTVRDLHQEYGNIFKHGNRNAASHLWSTFLMDRAPFMSAKRFETLSGGYCAVSGSPTTPMDQTRYQMRLDRVDGSGKQKGFMYYCCWPCVCDTQDFIRVDTKTIVTTEGPKEYSFAVIGNPCDRPSEINKPFDQHGRSTTIAQAAAEVRCGPGGRLEGATMSDNGYVIISLFFTSPSLGDAADESEFAEMCADRKAQGYNSGMGEIFRRVAAISPIEFKPALARLPGMTAKQLRTEAVRRGLDTRGVADKTDLVTMLERSFKEDLRKRSVKQLRAEASRRGLDMRGVVDKADLLRLLEAEPPASAATKTKRRNGAKTTASQSRPQSEEAQEEAEELAEGQSLEALPTRKLLAEAKRRGISTRGIADRADLLMLLQPASVAETGDKGEIDRAVDVAESDEISGSLEEAILFEQVDAEMNDSCFAVAGERLGAAC